MTVLCFVRANFGFMRIAERGGTESHGKARWSIESSHRVHLEQHLHHW